MTALTPPAFWMLTSLARQRRHGYEILRATETESEGRVKLKVATLYAALERLEREGLVAADGEEVVNGRARRYFRITEEGRGRLEAEATAMMQAAAAARAQLVSSRRATGRGGAVPA